MANVQRTVNRWSNLYYMVKITNLEGEWNNIPSQLPATTDVFRICTISNTSYYGTATEEANPVDWNLGLGSIDNSFNGLISQDPLAKIPSIKFSIDNLELIYHQLSEANGGDLNVFYGAEVKVYLCNGYVPGMFWDSANTLWRDEDGGAYNDQIAGPGGTYPDNDFSYRVFTGTINDIQFSMATTSFGALGVADKINTAFGTLAGVNSDFKTRGDIIPITYGDWSREGDLAPLILERSSSDVPRAFLDTQPLDSLNNLRLYDKVSELDYKVENQKSINDDNNIVTFQNENSSAALEKNITDDPTDWNNGSELGNVLRNHFPADNQLLFNLNGEVVAFQHDFGRFPSNPNYITNRSAARGWSGGELLPHSSSEELFELDADIQKANAVITIPLEIGEFYLESGSNLGAMRGTGSLQLTLQNLDPLLEDQTHQEYFWRVGAVPNDNPIVVFPFKFKDFGFDGEVLDFTIDYSFLAERFNDLVATDVPTFIECQDSNGTTLFNFQLFTGNGTIWDFENNSNNLTASFPSTSDIKEGLQWRFELVTSVNDFPEIPTNLQLNYLQLQCQIRVYAENGLWYWRGTGRTDPTLLEAPYEVYSDILEKELEFTDFINNTISRSDWKVSTSIYGKEPQWRNWAKKFNMNMGTASFSSYLGQEVMFDLEKKETPDHTLTANQVELKSDLQEINYTFTDRMDLYNEFIIKFRKNPANSQFFNILSINENEIQSTDALEFLSGDAPGLRSRCASASSSLGLLDGEKKQFIFEADAVRNQRTAEQLLQHFVRWHTSTKAIVKVSGILSETYDWELGEQVVLGNIQGLPQKLLDAQYIITGKTINPNLNGQGPSISFTFTEVIA